MSHQTIAIYLHVTVMWTKGFICRPVALRLDGLITLVGRVGSIVKCDLIVLEYRQIVGKIDCLGRWSWNCCVNCELSYLYSRKVDYLDRYWKDYCVM